MARMTPLYFHNMAQQSMEQAQAISINLWLPRRLRMKMRDQLLDNAARALVKQYISARREREARKVQQCYDAVGA